MPAMYQLPPIFTPLPAEALTLPTRMYTLPVIQGSHQVHFGGAGAGADESAVLADLTQRQGQLQTKLADMQASLGTVRQAMGLSATPAFTSSGLSSRERCHVSASSSSSSSHGQAGDVDDDGGASQGRIMSRIQALKVTLAQLKRALGDDWGQREDKLPARSGVGESSTATSGPGVPVSLVVRANPSHPPRSLMCLLGHFRAQSRIHGPLAIATSCHMHSSLTDSHDELKTFLASEADCERTRADLAIMIIWTKISRDPELVVGKNVIRGEANMLRYLARLFGHLVQYEDAADTAKLDQWLDMIHSDLIWGNAPSRKRAAAAIDAVLTKQPSLTDGKDLGLADFLAWSALVNSHSLGGHAKAHMKHWLKMCERLAGPGARSASSSSPRSRQSSSSGKQRPRRTSHRHRTKSRGKSESSSLPSSPEAAPCPVQQKVFKHLDSLQIKYTNVPHPVVPTVEVMLPHLKSVSDANGAICKNLFLRDKKKRLFLLTCLHDRDVDLTSLGKKIGTAVGLGGQAKDLRFGDESVLVDKLGVKQGCVTPFALMNDAGKDVTFVADQALVDGSFPTVHFHPLINTATTGISVEDFKRFVDTTGHKLFTVKF